VDTEGLLIKAYMIKIPIPVIQLYNPDWAIGVPTPHDGKLYASPSRMPTYLIGESTSYEIMLHAQESITPFFLEGLVSKHGHLGVWEFYYVCLNNHPNGNRLLKLDKELPRDSIRLIKEYFQEEFGSTDPYLIPDIIQSRSIMDFSPLMTPHDLIQKLYYKAFEEFSNSLRKSLDQMIRNSIAGSLEQMGFSTSTSFGDYISTDTIWGNFNG
jgi:hypothetical protein